MDGSEKKILLERLIPRPKSIRFNDGGVYAIRSRCKVELNVKDHDGAEKMISSLFREYWNVLPEIVLNQDLKIRREGSSEAYSVSVSEKQLTLTAEGRTGLMNAMKTLRQLAEVCRGTDRTDGFFLVQCEIDDRPAMSFRGIHLCIFPETELWEIEKRLRLAAYHKFNYAVIETWGVFPFKSHPEFCWPDRKIDRKALKKLVGLGKEIGITLIPQFNLLGHASASRVMSGKHVVLDFHPELQPLFEPDGWTWCISNPETRRILTDLVSELCGFYQDPPMFHIGCDEAYSFGSCFSCRKHVLKDLLRDHIAYFHDLLRDRGIRTIMWHDMLLERDDKRWKNYVTYGESSKKLSSLYKELPSDIMIADWQYGYPETDGKEPEWPTVRFFKHQKFDVLVCPWLEQKGIRSLARLAASESLAGMLETTWHIEKIDSIYGVAPSAAWNPDKTENPSFRLSIAHHMRQIGWDMGIDQYARSGWIQDQTVSGKHEHS